MLRAAITGLDESRLRIGLSVFFLALAIPACVLFWQSYNQMKWEAFHYYRQLAEELSLRIDEQFTTIIDLEESRRFSDYTFLNVAGDPTAKFLQRSPLSVFPIKTGFPGLLGYFQVDSAGMLSSPLLPEDANDSIKYGVSTAELQQRKQLHEHVRKILKDNALVIEKTTILTNLEQTSSTKTPYSRDETGAMWEGVGQQENAKTEISSASTMQKSSISQAGFDQLNALPATQPQDMDSQSQQLHVKDLDLEPKFKSKANEQKLRSKSNKLKTKRSKRREQEILPEPNKASLTAPVSTQTQTAGVGSAELDDSNLRQFNQSDYRISIFESEIDAFEISQLNSGHFVMFRKVWRDGQRYIQGLLFDPDQLFKEVVSKAYNNTALSQMSNMVVAYEGNVFASFSGQSTSRQYRNDEELRGTLLHQTRVSAPLHELELIFSIDSLPVGPGGFVVIAVTGVLMSILCGGFYLIYRLGLSQIKLVQQQQDFVSAVSHELKTPLTSIRMYGEMLREGWAEENKKLTYYNFIFDESERLSRLINNVLQLARMTRNEQQLDLRKTTVAALMDGIRSKIITQLKGAGFTLNLGCEEAMKNVIVMVDHDYFMQIIINLVDNSLKFAKHAKCKTIDVKCQQLRNNGVQFSVRDYGPGVHKDQMKKIFTLFYRSENELTRETVGTGIGLALVQQLSLAMGGKVDLVNQNPGAEVRVVFQPVENAGS